MAAVAALRGLKDVALRTIDNLASELYELNQKIWKKPELGYQEKYAHEVLTKFLSDKGFEVTPHHTLDTAFRAASGRCTRRVVGFICEYDALPGIGHACGHNLIAEVGVGAALGKLKPPTLHYVTIVGCASEMKTYLEPFDVVFEITLDLRVVIVVVVFFNGSRYILSPQFDFKAFRLHCIHLN